ncbi:MAG: DUF3667 domain-containing protein [Bacteroidetes bacterium]|nr:DUF3667 domain-containing protein [Bacteroidota bacterium]
MSHARLRKENNCLNCDAVVDGPYCKNCGQLNAEPKQTLWHLLTHFIEDVTHFDGKFFVTMKSLLVRPGFLSSEYLKGRRTKYLDPVRLYLFVSAIFFVIVFAGSQKEQRITVHNNPVLVYATDSTRATDSGKRWGYYRHNTDGQDVQVLFLPNYLTHGYKYYDSLQRALPASKKSNWFDRYFEKRLIGVWETYDNDPYNFFREVLERIQHSFSKMFFISLPIFAFFLYLLYYRRRKQYYYVSHAIFSLHYYTISFFFLLLIKLSLAEFIPEFLGNILMTIGIGGIFVYLYIAMLRFYKQGWFKTFVKFLFLSVAAIILITVITIGMSLNSFFSMAS